MTLKINRNSGKAPRELVDQIVNGRALPITVQLTHKNVLPLVVPSSGINTALEPGQAYDVKVKTFQQAWHLVTDLSELAARADNSADDYAVVVAPGTTKAAKAPAAAAVAQEAKQ